ncbi:unnamed protein product [Diatraea saccharalis]|uniref:DUF4774 domain-containing protein n=1 Tax=Diatraea saccharalis TaxID=40085 RepID=A0A9N9QXI3_9NEOP|nr:unnamed protein product [Diatraea saccharalis]
MKDFEVQNFMPTFVRVEQPWHRGTSTHIGSTYWSTKERLTLGDENLAMTPLTIKTEEPREINSKEERSLIYEDDPGVEVGGGNTKDIIEKIKAVNDGLKTPVKRPPVNYNTQPQTGGGYVIDKEILDKIQQIITAGKLNPMSLSHKYQESNNINNNDLGGPRNSRNMPFGLNQRQIAMTSLPYMTSIPVIVMPTPSNNMFNGDVNTIDASGAYQTRQSPSLPFPFQWPLAPFFPILIKDPLLNFLGGGSWNNLIDYGQSADVCNRKQKSVENDNIDNESIIKNLEENLPSTVSNSRQARALKKRTISTKSSIENNLENLKKVKKYFSSQSTTKKPSRPSYIEEQPQDTKTVNSDDGDLRFPFGDFSWFGNKKPVVPSPGFIINRLKVRRGGVAIAGPGGVATAGRGGTAIVGPGGLAYTQPGGLAVAGPSARIIALSPDADLSSVVSRLQEQSATDGSVPRLLEAIPEGKVVATGPIIYYHPTEQTFHRGRWGDFQRDYGRKSSGFSRRSDEYQYNGASFVKGPWMAKDSFILYLKPTAHAMNSPRGVAVANPVSNVLVSRNDIGSIVHSPVASAIVGPGGIAHAQSDLNLYEANIQYLPFYGGAKGNYLEVKKDNAGTVTSEKIVPEEKISSENVLKHSNENLLSKVLAANLIRLRTTSGSLLKLHNLGRRLGFLNNDDKAKFKEQLSSLEEIASNTIKIIDDIGTDVDMLFKNNATIRSKYDDEYVSIDKRDTFKLIDTCISTIEEEGVSIEAPTDDETQIPLQGATIAEAKPVGLAVIGENGLAASRPVATAVASSGVAIARPIATAIAGVNPADLGINFQVGHEPHPKK